MLDVCKVVEYIVVVLDLNLGVPALGILMVLVMCIPYMMVYIPSGETHGWYTREEPTKLCVPTTTLDSELNL